MLIRSAGLIRVRDSLQAQRLELAKQKPKAKSDENIISEISRLEATITVARDDLVSLPLFLSHRLAGMDADIDSFVLDGLQAACDWIEGRVEAC